MKVPKDLFKEYLRERCRQEISNEIAFLTKVKHPFIIGFVECFPYKENDPARRMCIILEYADGCSLLTKMKTLNRPIPEKLALTWFAQACLALAKLHESGTAHRDVKPDNILIVGDMAGAIIKIADFGSIKKIEGHEKQTYLVGTNEYFAPEKENENYDEKVDVWSIAVVLYEMLTGGGHPMEFDFKLYSSDIYVKQLP